MVTMKSVRPPFAGQDSKRRFTASALRVWKLSAGHRLICELRRSLRFQMGFWGRRRSWLSMCLRKRVRGGLTGSTLIRRVLKGVRGEAGRNCVCRLKGSELLRRSCKVMALDWTWRWWVCYPTWSGLGRRCCCCVLACGWRIWKLTENVTVEVLGFDYDFLLWCWKSSPPKLARDTDNYISTASSEIPRVKAEALLRVLNSRSHSISQMLFIEYDLNAIAVTSERTCAIQVIDAWRTNLRVYSPRRCDWRPPRDHLFNIGFRSHRNSLHDNISFQSHRFLSFPLSMY